MPTEHPIEVNPQFNQALAGGSSIWLEGIAGTVIHSRPDPAPSGYRFRGYGAPANEDSTLDFRNALEELDIAEQETIRLDVAPAYRFRGAAAPTAPMHDQLVIHAAPPADRNAVQVVLYQDESGGLSWHFPDGFRAQSTPPAVLFRNAASGATFTIPTRTAAAQAALGNGSAPRFRGPFTKWGRKIFKVLAIPLLDPLLADPVQWLGAKIEAKYRQELIRPLSADNYQKLVSTPFTDWNALAGKRSLLIVHGIFSTTHGVLAKMPRSTMEELSARYGGRMIALDQLTVSRSPEENANTLLNALPRGSQFEFDILCHSRGGIVARTLAERGHVLAPQSACTFPNVFFVATPNSGSVLADADHLLDMIDVFTNLLTSFPDGPALYSIEVLLGLVKLCAVTSARHLPGLAAMGTGVDGYIAQKLNRGAMLNPDAPSYAAAAADYQPDPQGENSFLTGRIGHAAIDRVFKSSTGAVANDLVVPYEGVFSANGHPSFPIRNPVTFGGADHVWHTGFFAQPRVLEAIKKHFAEAPVRSFPVFRGGGENLLPPEPVAPLPEPREIRREPQLDFFEQVNSGVQHPLTVRLADLQSATSSTAVAFQFAAGETETTVTVILRAPGFDVEGSNSLPLVLRATRAGGAEQVLFLVTARPPKDGPERRELCAEFWHRNRCVGAVRHFTFVLPADSSGGPSAGEKQHINFVLREQDERIDPDLCVIVNGFDEPEEPPYLMQVFSIAPGFLHKGTSVGKFKPDTKGEPLSDYLGSLYRSQFKRLQAGNQSFPEWEAQFNSELDGLGRKLWTWLPEKFRNLYLEMHHKGADIRSLLISSSEMIMPWELIIPHEGSFSLPPLGRSHILGRWKPAQTLRPDPQRMRVGRFCVLNPHYPDPKTLPSAEQEAEELQKLFTKSNVISPADFSTVKREVLDRSDVSVFHFSGHGDFDSTNADLNTLLLLNGGTLSAAAIASASFHAGTPLVYLNACHAAVTETVVGRLGGFCSNFLDSGSCGVLAPYWPVEDNRAREFALALYQKLWENRSVGEALQELREENPRDLTFRAFAFFGDPWLRLDFSDLN